MSRDLFKYWIVEYIRQKLVFSYLSTFNMEKRLFKSICFTRDTCCCCLTWHVCWDGIWQTRLFLNEDNLFLSTISIAVLYEYGNSIHFVFSSVAQNRDLATLLIKKIQSKYQSTSILRITRNENYYNNLQTNTNTHYHIHVWLGTVVMKVLYRSPFTVKNNKSSSVLNTFFSREIFLISP